MLKKIYKYFIFAFLILIALLKINQDLLPKSIVYNRTDSIPLGLYIANKNKPFELTNPGIACYNYSAQDWAKDRKYLPENYIVCKRIIGVAGDIVQYFENEVKVFSKKQNKEYVFIVAKRDSKNRPLPQPAAGTSIVIPEGAIYMAGDSAMSLDSRYLGLVSTTKIIYTVEPFFLIK